MKHLFIVNPVAGKGKALKFVPEIKRIFENRPEDYCIEYTARPGHATEIVRKYVTGNPYRVYSVGGDGTLNEILNGIVGSESSLAIIPAGSGNDFVKSIINGPITKNILADTVNGREQTIDLARINGKYFINIASAGFDAVVTDNALRLKKVPFVVGGLTYFLAILITMLKYRNYHLQISIDNHHFSGKTLLVAVANGKYYGGGILPAPEARLDDGSFDICYISEKSFLEILRFLPQFIKGRHGKLEGVHFYRGKKVSIRCDEEITLNIDGEVAKAKEATLEIIPQGIKIIVPNSCSCSAERCS